MTTTVVIPNTQRAWGWMMALKRVKGGALENAGKVYGSLPHTSIASPLNIIETAMVIIIRVNTLAFFIGSIVNLSINAPRIVTTPTVRKKPTGRDRCRVPVMKTITRPPRTTNSPWAKLITSVTLYIML